jgi:hypothetical protein
MLAQLSLQSSQPDSRQAKEDCAKRVSKLTIRMMMNGSCDVIELVSVLGRRLQQRKAYESSEAHTLPSAPVSIPSLLQLAITSHNTSTPERHCSALLSFTQRCVCV